KTTSVEMLTYCLKAAGAKAIAAGNIGIPLSQVALQEEKWDYVVVEVSSFQLENASSFHPAAAALLNITPDHLDRHGAFENYRNLKLKLLQQVPEKGLLALKKELLNDPVIAAALKNRSFLTFSAEPGQKADFCCSDTAIGACFSEEFHPLLEWSKLLFTGKHNYENAMCVLALLQNLPVDQEKVRSALSQFRGGHHRLEKVAEIDGVTYINDSKATNVDAMIKALECCGTPKEQKIILIAGGVDKGCTLQEAKTYLKMYVKQVLLIGDCRHRLAREWRDDVPLQECSDFETAMNAAVAAAQKGDIVLLSPACASFDMFMDYCHRGQSFVEFVEKLKKE
ncbi:MAG: UDP-N-acetylmuramoyl-L-alanine--D-glutamate ligase, partial [Lentisphaeria bacterium]